MPSLAQPNPALNKNLEIILDYHHTGTLAAGATDQSLPVSTPATPGGTNGSLGPNEFVELLARETWSPFSTAGVMEDLRNLYLILDSGDNSQKWMNASGRADLNTAPPAFQNIEGHKLTFYGGGILEAAFILQNPLPGEDSADTMGRALAALAVPRASSSVVQVAQAGDTDVTGDFHVRWWGHRWTAAEIRARFSGIVFGGRVRVKDPWANNGAGLFIEFNVPEVAVTPETFTALMGGNSQNGTQVWPFERYSIATQASDGSKGEYDFTWNGSQQSQVKGEYQNLDFNYAVGTAAQGTKNNILIVTGWGVRPLIRSADDNATDLTSAGNVPATQEQYLKLIGNTPHEEQPNNGLPATNTDNPQIFGWTYPVIGSSSKIQYRALQSHYRTPIARRRGVVAFQDSGTIVPANTVGAAVKGLLITNYTALSVGE